MPRRKSAENRKAEIVSKVLALAFEIGPDRLSANQVAQALGLTQPAIFRHFPTKGALWMAVAEELATELRWRWDAAEADATDTEHHLRSLIAAQLTAIREIPALPSILFSRELTVDNPDLRAVFAELLAAFQSRLAATFARLQASGRVTRGVAAEDAGVLFTSLVQGVAIRWTLGARSFPLVEEGTRLFDVQMALLRPVDKRTG